ncbi:MAG: hypothetical protein IPG00_01570 [Saprospiraceae bacterium]|nr:hypothetical protein [Saprospiraceae bacterium]
MPILSANDKSENLWISFTIISIVGQYSVVPSYDSNTDGSSAADVHRRQHIVPVRGKYL